MAKKHAHEEHANHEAWAIPYGDLITLLLALFVVMYAVSSVNEGKYRVLSDSLATAFGGPPKSMRPIQLGQKVQHGADGAQYLNMKPSEKPQPPSLPLKNLHDQPKVIQKQIQTMMPAVSGTGLHASDKQTEALSHMAGDIESALSGLIKEDLVIVRKAATWVEVEIKTDILFSSGSAQLADAAIPVLRQLGGILKPLPYKLRVEGHTDNVPVHNVQFPSNWELSGARAASVVRVMMSDIDPTRMTVQGYGEFRPAGSNTTPEGRNRNRRVVIVILGGNLPERAAQSIP